MIKRQWFIEGRYTDSDGAIKDFGSIVSVRWFFSNASMAHKALVEHLKKNGADDDSIVIRTMNRV